MAAPVLLYGGSFDPVHRAHIATVEAALQQLAPRQLRVIPCHIPPHKSPTHASAEQRLAMLNIAFADLDKVMIDTRELQRESVSYTYDTVVTLRQELGSDASLGFILGWDSWCNFNTWHRWRDILSQVNLVLVKRPGAYVNAAREDDQVLARYFEQHQVAIAELAASPAGKIAIMDTTERDIASRDIRQRLSQGLSINGLVSPEVTRYIAQHKLYTSLKNSNEQV